MDISYEGHAFLASRGAALRDEHLLAVTWPEEYGSFGLTAAEQLGVAEEFIRASRNCWLGSTAGSR